jgi:hypothetical protein
MSTPRPFLADSQGRRFARSAVAVQAIIVDADEHVLLLSSPACNHPGEWQVISGPTPSRSGHVMLPVQAPFVSEVGPPALCHGFGPGNRMRGPLMAG